MATLSPEETAYLEQLRISGGADPENTVSMHDVGAALGLARPETGQLAESLFMGGYAELKTLSGGIGITAMGLEALGVSAPIRNGGLEKEDTLGEARVMSEASKKRVEAVLADLKTALENENLSYDRLEEVVSDIRTLEVHLLSPAPKTAVVRALFTSLSHALETGRGFSRLAKRLDRLAQG